MAEPRYLSQGATFSACKKYRYRLWREWWSLSVRTILWVLLNPSTADAEHLDPTLRRCLSYSNMWGFGHMEIVNIFAWRSTDPEGLKHSKDPVGPGNDDAILEAAHATDRIVVGWGVHGHYLDRDLAVYELLRGAHRELHCLGVTKHGHPKHPLYVPSWEIPTLYHR